MQNTALCIQAQAHTYIYFLNVSCFTVFHASLCFTLHQAEFVLCVKRGACQVEDDLRFGIDLLAVRGISEL